VEGAGGEDDDVVKPSLEGRCGTCARFVRVTETIDQNGEVLRTGQCLLGVWSPPLYETNTCGQHIRRGQVREALRVAARPRRPTPGEPRAARREHATSFVPKSFTLPEEITDMDAEEFRQVLRDVLRDELGVSNAPIGSRWEGGELVLRPGKEGTAEKRIPIESLFHKVVMIRDKLRVLEQKVNAHPRLSVEDKVQMQQYVTQCYGSLTTFNVLFAERSDGFTGQKGDKDD
jgi:uncharacterized membrane protein